ncbi:SIS domain-containing protein [Novosphingobium rosa]|uniref:SIS domain-containing protein n=1 Tax=Novosphingobium rosa TaxID=76978 RepID=UPI0008367BAC|nr:SIS domain-containing protein [Novosphingobium rosa]
MASVVTRDQVVDTLDQAVSLLPEAFAFGESLASEIDRIYFVAHGSGNRAMQAIGYWIEHYSPSIEVRRYFPSEFMAMNPPRLDERTLVMLSSKSGTTPETNAAAEFLKDKPCKVVSFTMKEESPLAKASPKTFIVGDNSESLISLFMVMQALVGGVMKGRDGWALGDKLLSSLSALPAVVGAVAESSDARGLALAKEYYQDETIYHVASGPGFMSAYNFGVCILMEMLWLHSYPIEAAEFFHGPFEILDEKTPFILIVGEDPSRPLMERVMRFCEKHGRRIMTFDSRDFDMPGIDPEIRPMLAPHIVQTALKRFSEHLSDLRGQPLSTRRYMWKMEY